jgi:hypothetical protein
VGIVAVIIVAAENDDIRFGRSHDDATPAIHVSNTTGKNNH